MSNFRFRVRESVKILATGENDVKNRLELACVSHLFLATPFLEEELPFYFKEKWEGTFIRLTSKEWGALNIEGDRLRATLHGMHKTTASKIALEVWELYREYEEYLKSGLLPEKNS